MKERLAVAAGLFFATGLFFFEYLPWWKRVHLFGDIEGYHYPLYTFAHRAVREWRIPEWDPSIYCGLPFAANPQAAVFYPPNWLVYFANRMHRGVRFWTIEALAILHFWVACLGAWMWLRPKVRAPDAALLAAMGFAYGGYMLSETQHLGVICAFAWFPLGLYAVDRRSVRGVALVSGLVFLAGYPPAWVAFAVCAATYALARRTPLVALAGLALSVPLLAVILLPGMEAAEAKTREAVYGGGGIGGGWGFYLQFALPNFYDNALSVGRPGPELEAYLYLGSLCLLGVLAGWRSPVAGALLVVSLVVIRNTFGIPAALIEPFPVLKETLRDWNFLAVFPVAAALAAAAGFDRILGASRYTLRWLPPAAIAATALWCGWLLWTWNAGGHFATGWMTLSEMAVTVALAWLLLRSPRRWTVTAALLALAWTEYKVYGTSRRFNAVAGSVDRNLDKDMRTGGREFTGLDNIGLAQLRRFPDGRIALADSPYGTDLRHYGVSTPQGFDPFLPTAYRQAVERYTPWMTNRLFAFDWKNAAMIDEFGVRFLLSLQPIDHPLWRQVGPDTSYFKLYQHADARLAWRFEAGSARVTRWTAERRAFQVDSTQGGPFLLIEQHFPGWQAAIDGRPVPIVRAREAFQQIAVPAGRHEVEFGFRSQSLRWGGACSLLTLAGLLGWPWVRRRWRPEAATGPAPVPSPGAFRG